MLRKRLCALCHPSEDEDGGGGGGGGGLIEILGLAFADEVVYSASGASKDSQEGPTQIPIPSDGQLLSLAINPFQNELDGPAIITVRLNGENTTLQINVPQGSTDVVIVDSVVDVTAGDLVSLQTDTDITGATSGFIQFRATYELGLPAD